MWRIEYTKEACKQLEALTKTDRELVLSKLETLAQLDKPLAHLQVKFLTGPLRKFFRFRVSDIRVIFQPDHSTERIIVFTVLHRKNTYK